MRKEVQPEDQPDPAGGDGVIGQCVERGEDVIENLATLDEQLADVSPADWASLGDAGRALLCVGVAYFLVGVVVPIAVQQAIDDIIKRDEVRMGFVGRCAAIAAVAFLTVVIAIDPAGSYPHAFAGPGLTVDESFNVQQGVRLWEGLKAFALGGLTIREVYGDVDELGPNAPFHELRDDLRNELDPSLAGRALFEHAYRDPHFPDSPAPGSYAKKLLFPF